jgi:hypothetical protein
MNPPIKARKATPAGIAFQFFPSCSTMKLVDEALLDDPTFNSFPVAAGNRAGRLAAGLGERLSILSQLQHNKILSPSYDPPFLIDALSILSQLQLAEDVVERDGVAVLDNLSILSQLQPARKWPQRCSATPFNSFPVAALDRVERLMRQGRTTFNSFPVAACSPR